MLYRISWSATAQKTRLDYLKVEIKLSQVNKLTFSAYQIRKKAHPNKNEMKEMRWTNNLKANP